MKRAVCVLLILLAAGAARAQDVTPPSTPTLLGAVLARVATPEPPQPVTLAASDARTAVCAAPTLPDFVPYVVRAGDRLAALVAGQNTITVTQLAALNCLDDPDALPVGAVIWLPEAPPAAAATPEASPAVTPQPAHIDAFSASAEAIINTDTVTLNWSARGSRAYLYLCLAAAPTCSRPPSAAVLPLAGSLSVAGYPYAGTYRYRLEVEGSAASVSADVSLAVTCAQEWLGGVGALPLCPEAPARTVFAVWQPFEHGALLWFSDVKQIFVLTDDGTLRVYTDAYVEGEPDPAATAPAGLFTPLRGFGLLWETLGGAQGALGWATAPEAGFDGARQAAGHTSYTTYVAGPDGIVYAVTQLPGMEVGYWTQVAG